MEVATKNDWESLQRDLRIRGGWAIKEQMKYNVDKCKDMHRRKTTLTTSMGSKLAAAAAQGLALGVNVGSSLEMSSQCSAADKKANGRLAMIKRGAEEKSEQNILALCQAMLNNPSAPALGAEQGEAQRVGLAGTHMEGN